MQEMLDDREAEEKGEVGTVDGEMDEEEQMEVVFEQSSMYAGESIGEFSQRIKSSQACSQEMEVYEGLPDPLRDFSGIQMPSSPISSPHDSKEKVRSVETHSSSLDRFLNDGLDDIFVQELMKVEERNLKKSVDLKRKRGRANKKTKVGLRLY